MKPALFHRPPSIRQAAFSLGELMVAVGILVIGGAVAFPFLSGDLGLYARNFSINKSNNSLRYSLQYLKRDLDMSIEPPVLVTASVTGAGVTTLTPLASTSYQGAQAMLAYVNYGPAYQIPPSDTKNTPPVAAPIKPGQAITINRYVATAANLAADPNAVTSPLPQVGDRVLFMSPGPYTTGMPEYMDLATGKAVKTASSTTLLMPGRLITAVNPASDPATGTPVSQFTITIDQTNPLPATNGNCQVKDNNSVYFFRQSAYVASTINDAAGKPLERQLLYYRSITNLTKPLTLIRDLDPIPQEVQTDTHFAANTLVQPFTYFNRSSSKDPLAVSLPIRALDYSRAIGDRNLGGATTGTSAAEFNVYLRSSTLMNIKGRLDDNSLSSITAN